MSEQTLIILKPDAIETHHAGDIIKIFEQKGFTIVKAQLMNATKEKLAKHYAHLVDKPFYKEIEDYMLEGPIMPIVVEGTNIVNVAHKLAGNTNPSLAEPGTIRNLYARDWDDGIIRNVIHTSDSVETAKKEINIWFD